MVILMFVAIELLMLVVVAVRFQVVVVAVEMAQCKVLKEVEVAQSLIQKVVVVVAR